MSRTFRNLSLACVSCIGMATVSQAQESMFPFTGQVDLGYRYYPNDGQFAGQSESGFSPFLGLKLNGNLDVGLGEVTLQFTGLLDDENDRSFLNVQKAYFSRTFDSWDIVLGYNIEDWGVSSGRTIVNVLNARNQTNQLGNSDLIGTLMANANVFTDAGTFSLYVLGDNIADNFGGLASRERAQLVTDDRLTRFEDDNSTDVAFRFSNSYSIGDASLDIGASVYHGTNREALLLPGCVQADATVPAAACDAFNNDLLASYQAGATVDNNDLGDDLSAVTALTPYYQEIRQYGLTAVYARGNTQFRFEGFVREAADETFTGAIVGGDHSFFNFMGGDGTLVTALEYHFDDRSDRQPTTIYQDDLFVGLNYAHNDPNDTKFDVGLFYDLEESSKILTLSASRRIGDRVRVGVRANHISADSSSDPLSNADDDSYVEFTLSTFF